MVWGHVPPPPKLHFPFGSVLIAKLCQCTLAVCFTPTSHVFCHWFQSTRNVVSSAQHPLDEVFNDGPFPREILQGLNKLPTLLACGKAANSVRRYPCKVPILSASAERRAMPSLQYCDKGSLANAIRARKFINRSTGQANIKALLLCLRDVARGMAYLHDSNVM